MAIEEIKMFRTGDGSFFDTMEEAEAYVENHQNLNDLRDFLYGETVLNHYDSLKVAETILEAFKVTRK